MADSYETEGQIQPAAVREVAGKPQLVYGLLRLLAVKEYNRRHPDRPMKFLARLLYVNDAEALKLLSKENQF